MFLTDCQKLIKSTDEDIKIDTLDLIVSLSVTPAQRRALGNYEMLNYIKFAM